MSILLTNIQRFSLHDGPGIRTTIFLKGCALRCPWCSNPENLLPEQQIYIKDGIEGTYGKWYESEVLVKECLKDKAFYEGKVPPEKWNIREAEEIEHLPGGVTFSGGEPLLQMEQLVPVCKALHDEGLHIVVETCLFVPPVKLCLALNHIDFFYVDVKIVDEEKCSTVERGNLALYLQNLDILFTSGKPVVIRIPVIGEQTDDEENRRAVKELLEKYKDRILKIELIKEHNLAESKYRSLGMKMSYHGVSNELMELYKEELSELGIKMEICKI